MSTDIGMSSSLCGSVRTVLLLNLIGVALAARSLGDSAPASSGSRLTIRGTGNNIWVDRAPAPPAEPAEPKKPLKSKVVATSPVLEEAIRMKSANASDAAVISYLKRHTWELPAMIDLETVQRLHSAGAGENLLGYLQTASSIEIGMTWAYGGGPAADASIAPEPEEEPGYAMTYGVPVYGGYSVPPGRSRFRALRRPGAMHFHRGPGFFRPTAPLAAPAAPAPPRIHRFGSVVR